MIDICRTRKSVAAMHPDFGDPTHSKINLTTIMKEETL